MNLLAVAAVEVARRLVGQQHGRGVDECTGDGHALLLAARELRRLVVAPRRKAHHRQQLVGTLLNLRPGTAADEPRNADIFEGGEFGQQVVKLEDEADALVAETRQGLVAQRKDIRTVDFDPARVGTRQGTHNLQQRGLAGAAGPDDGHHLAAAHLE